MGLPRLDCASSFCLIPRMSSILAKRGDTILRIAALITWMIGALKILENLLAIIGFGRSQALCRTRA
jgi:hypothetical protein